MASRVSHTTINCTDAYELSEWWKPVLGYTDVPGDPNEPGHDHCMIVDPASGHQLLFLEVADRRRPDGSGWMVLADPEGNLFCIVRSDQERA